MPEKTALKNLSCGFDIARWEDHGACTGGQLLHGTVKRSRTRARLVPTRLTGLLGPHVSVALMTGHRLVLLPPSPWSVHARWVFAHRRLSYPTTEHVPFVGERRLHRLVGQKVQTRAPGYVWTSPTTGPEMAQACSAGPAMRGANQRWTTR
jgi:hypothetical protein